MEKWQEGLIPGPPVIGQGVMDEGDPAALALAEEVAWCSRELLATRGWVLWECSVLGGDIITVVLDKNVEGVTGGYPVYTVAELEELGEMAHSSRDIAVGSLYVQKGALGEPVPQRLRVTIGGGVNRCDGDFPITSRKP